MKDKGDFFILACILICIVMLQISSVSDGRCIKKLDSKIKANDEAIALLCSSMQTNKVVVEAFMMNFNSAKEQQNKVNIAIGDVIAIAFKAFAEQKDGSQ